MMTAFQRMREIIEAAPSSVKPALKSYFLYQRGVLNRAEFRLDVFQHIRRDNVQPLSEFWNRLSSVWVGSETGADCIEADLKDLLDDDQWPSLAVRGDPTDEELESFRQRHRAGIAAVRDYLRRLNCNADTTRDTQQFTGRVHGDEQSPESKSDNPKSDIDRNKELIRTVTDRWIGIESLCRSGVKLFRVRIDHVEMTDEHIRFAWTLLPTRGLYNCTF